MVYWESVLKVRTFGLISVFVEADIIKSFLQLWPISGEQRLNPQRACDVGGVDRVLRCAVIFVFVFMLDLHAAKILSC